MPSLFRASNGNLHKAMPRRILVEEKIRSIPNCQHEEQNIPDKQGGCGLDKSAWNTWWERENMMGSKALGRAEVKRTFLFPKQRLPWAIRTYILWSRSQTCTQNSSIWHINLGLCAYFHSLHIHKQEWNIQCIKAAFFVSETTALKCRSLTNHMEDFIIISPFNQIIHRRLRCQYISKI